jgi:hypothetical protein
MAERGEGRDDEPELQERREQRARESGSRGEESREAAAMLSGG